MRHCSFWATLAIVSALHGVALADAPDADEVDGDASDQPEPAAPVAQPRSELLLHNYPGAVHLTPDPREGDAYWADVLIGTEGAYRYGSFIGSAFVQGGLGLPLFVSGGVAAGLSLHRTPGPRIDVLLSGGLDYYCNWGVGILSDDPGVSLVLPFAGPRVRAAYAFGRGRGHFEIGALLAWETNLTRTERSYSYVETPWLCSDSCAPYTTQAHHVVGGTKTLVALTLGGTIDGT
jgi:hypothetical protein